MEKRGEIVVFVKDGIGDDGDGEDDDADATGDNV